MHRKAMCIIQCLHASLHGPPQSHTHGANQFTKGVQRSETSGGKYTACLPSAVSYVWVLCMLKYSTWSHRASAKQHSGRMPLLVYSTRAPVLDYCILFMMETDYCNWLQKTRAPGCCRLIDCSRRVNRVQLHNTWTRQVVWRELRASLEYTHACVYAMHEWQKTRRIHGRYLLTLHASSISSEHGEKTSHASKIAKHNYKYDRGLQFTPPAACR
jgi:hypothetical protein